MKHFKVKHLGDSWSLLYGLKNSAAVLQFPIREKLTNGGSNSQGFSISFRENQNKVQILLWDVKHLKILKWLPKIEEAREKFKNKGSFTSPGLSMQPKKDHHKILCNSPFNTMCHYILYKNYK